MAAIGATVLVVLPVVVAAVRGVRGGWIPIGDNAFFAVRAADVFTRHHPLVGTWTSASLSTGVDVNNPGPLFFDLLALPVRLGPVAGLAVGAALVNIAAITGAAVFAWRRAGARGTVAVAVAMAALAWAMGSELLYDPWQPNALLFPFFFVLVAAWATSLGDLPALPWLVFATSLVVQTHMSYALLVAATSAVSVVGAAVAVRRGHHVGRPVRIAVIASGVAVACWVQPAIDQFAPSGFGNLGKLISHGGGNAATVGPGLATRLVASILAVPPFLGRPSIRRGFLTLGSAVPSMTTAVVGLAAFAAVLAASIAMSRRRGDHPATAAAAWAMLVAAVGLATASILPVSVRVAPPHQLLWLWPIGAFSVFALGLRIAGRLPRPGTALLCAAVAVLAVATLPTYNARSGPTADADDIPVARTLVEPLSAIEGIGPVILDTHVRFADPYQLAVMADLRRRNVDFRVEEPGMAHQVGISRRVDGTERWRVVQRDRDEALTTPPGGQLVSRVLGLTAAERHEMARLRSVVAADVDRRGLRLNSRGMAAAAAGDLGSFPDPKAVWPHPGGFVDLDEFVLIVTHRLTDLDPSVVADYTRYAELLRRWQRHTVAIFLVPE